MTDLEVQAVKTYQQSNSNDDFDKMYKLTNNTIAKYVYMLLRDPGKDVGRIKEQAEEVMQEAYISCMTNIKQLDDPSHYVAWMKTICRNKYMDRCLHDKHDNDLNDKIKYSISIGAKTGPAHDASSSSFEEVEADTTIMAPEKAAEDSALKQLIMKELDKLSAIQRIVLIGFYYDNKKTKELAEELKLNENTVKSYLKRGKESLGRSMGNYANANGLKLAPLALVPFMFGLFSEEVKACDLAGYNADSLLSQLHQKAVPQTIKDPGLAVKSATGTAKTAFTVSKIASVKAVTTIVAIGVTVAGVTAGTIAYQTKNKAGITQSNVKEQQAESSAQMDTTMPQEGDAISAIGASSAATSESSVGNSSENSAMAISMSEAQEYEKYDQILGDNGALSAEDVYGVNVLTVDDATFTLPVRLQDLVDLGLTVDDSMGVYKLITKSGDEISMSVIRKTANTTDYHDIFVNCVYASPDKSDNILFRTEAGVTSSCTKDEFVSCFSKAGITDKGDSVSWGDHENKVGIYAHYGTGAVPDSISINAIPQNIQAMTDKNRDRLVAKIKAESIPDVDYADLYYGWSPDGMDVYNLEIVDNGDNTYGVTLNEGEYQGGSLPAYGTGNVANDGSLEISFYADTNATGAEISLDTSSKGTLVANDDGTYMLSYHIDEDGYDSSVTDQKIYRGADAHQLINKEIEEYLNTENSSTEVDATYTGEYGGWEADEGYNQYAMFKISITDNGDSTYAIEITKAAIMTTGAWVIDGTGSNDNADGSFNFTFGTYYYADGNTGVQTATSGSSGTLTPNSDGTYSLSYTLSGSIPTTDDPSGIDTVSQLRMNKGSNAFDQAKVDAYDALWGR